MDALKGFDKLKRELAAKPKNRKGRQQLERAIATSIDVLTRYKHHDKNLGESLLKDVRRKFEAIYGGAK